MSETKHLIEEFKRDWSKDMSANNPAGYLLDEGDFSNEAIEFALGELPAPGDDPAGMSKDEIAKTATFLESLLERPIDERGEEEAN